MYVSEFFWQPNKCTKYFGGTFCVSHGMVVLKMTIQHLAMFQNDNNPQQKGIMIDHTTY